MGFQGSDSEPEENNLVSGWEHAMNEVIENEKSEHVALEYSAEQAIAEAFGTNNGRPKDPEGVPPTLIQSLSLDSAPLIQLASLESDLSSKNGSDDEQKGAEHGNVPSVWLDVAASSSSKGSQGSYADQVPALSGSGSALDPFDISQVQNPRSDLGGSWTIPDEATPERRLDVPVVQSKYEGSVFQSIVSAEFPDDEIMKADADVQYPTVHTRESDNLEDILGPNERKTVTTLMPTESVDEILGPNLSKSVTSASKMSATVTSKSGTVTSQSETVTSQSETVTSKKSAATANKNLVISQDESVDDILGPKKGPVTSRQSESLDDVLGPVSDKSLMSNVSGTKSHAKSVRSASDPEKSHISISSAPVCFHPVPHQGAQLTRNPSKDKPAPIQIPLSFPDNRAQVATLPSSQVSEGPFERIVASLDHHQKAQTRPVKERRAFIEPNNSEVSQNSTFESGSSFQTSPSGTALSGVSGEDSSWSDNKMHPFSPSSYTQNGSVSPDATSFSRNQDSLSADATSFSRNASMSQDATTFSHNTSRSQDAASFSRNGNPVSPSESILSNCTQSFSRGVSTSQSGTTISHSGTMTSISRGDTFDPSLLSGYTDNTEGTGYSGSQAEATFTANSRGNFIMSPGGESAITGFFTAGTERTGVTERTDVMAESLLSDVTRKTQHTRKTQQTTYSYQSKPAEVEVIPPVPLEQALDLPTQTVSPIAQRPFGLANTALIPEIQIPMEQARPTLPSSTPETTPAPPQTIPYPNNRPAHVPPQIMQNPYAEATKSHTEEGEAQVSDSEKRHSTLWGQTTDESEREERSVPPTDRQKSQLAQSLMARTRSRADTSTVVSQTSTGLGPESPSRPTMVRVGDQNDERFIANTAVARKRVSVVQLLMVGLMGLIVAFLGSFWVQSSCHFVSASVLVGDNDQIFELHYGLWKYTPIDSAFQGYSYCYKYDDEYTADAPRFSRFATSVAMVCGAFSLSVLWFYLIFGRGNRALWDAAVKTAFVAGVLQLSTLVILVGPVCKRDDCKIGPAGILSVMASIVYFVVAVEMHYNSPIQAWMDDIPACPSMEQPQNMMQTLEMSDFKTSAVAYVKRMVFAAPTVEIPTLNQIQRRNEDPIGEGMFDRDLATGVYKPPSIV